MLNTARSSHVWMTVSTYMMCQERTLCIFYICEVWTFNQERTHSRSAVGFSLRFGLVILENPGIDHKIMGVAWVRSWHWNYFLSHFDGDMPNLPNYHFKNFPGEQFKDLPKCGFGYLCNVRIRSAGEIMNYFYFYLMQAGSLHACVPISVLNSF